MEEIRDEQKIDKEEEGASVSPVQRNEVNTDRPRKIKKPFSNPGDFSF